MNYVIFNDLLHFPYINTVYAIYGVLVVCFVLVSRYAYICKSIYISKLPQDSVGLNDIQLVGVRICLGWVFRELIEFSAKIRAKNAHPIC